MKKLLCLGLALVLMAGLFAGCGNKPEEKPVETVGGSNETQSQTENVTKPQEETTAAVAETQLLTVPFKPVTARCDINRRVREEGYALLIYKDSFSLVGFCADTINTYENLKLEDVLDVFASGFPSEAAAASEGNMHGEKIEVASSEKVKVAGLDSICFTGKVANASGWDCHVYGYTFAIDNAPYAVIGIVSQKEQSEELIAANKAEVDQIAASIQTGQ